MPSLFRKELGWLLGCCPAAVVCAGETLLDAGSIVSSSLKRISSLSLEIVYSISDIATIPDKTHK